jgi:hypothetical protein
MIRLLMASAGLLLASFAAFAQAEKPWVTLQDGAKRGDWNEIGDANWRFEDGALVADKLTGKANGYLVSKNSYKDFEIRVEFWVSDDANSGVFMRCENGKVTASDCYEVNIFDQRPDPSYGTGAITDNIAKVVPMPKAGGKWNVFEIIAQGPHLVVVLNGQKTVDVQNGKHVSGPIALQYGQGVVKFRKVQIRTLS